MPLIPLSVLDVLTDPQVLELHSEVSRRAALIRGRDPAHQRQVRDGRNAGAAKARRARAALER